MQPALYNAWHQASDKPLPDEDWDPQRTDAPVKGKKLRISITHQAWVHRQFCELCDQLTLMNFKVHQGNQHFNCQSEMMCIVMFWTHQDLNMVGPKADNILKLISESVFRFTVVKRMGVPEGLLIKMAMDADVGKK